ncbi:MAG: type I-C CRISPR-associated protein Cas7/Csd2 [Trueperaceae bacterium]
MSKHLDPTVRHEFVMLFDVTDGNPNGDPDAGNLPRVDPETRHGLVTDVALKRKVRNYVDTCRGTEDRYKIYIQQGAVLNERNQRAYTALGKNSKKPNVKDISEARAWMCANFFDVRAFGAVMSTEVNAGQVRGPVQLTFARSVDPILGLDISITRVAVTKPGEGREGDDQSSFGTMGRKAFIPYGLYRAHGFFVPSFADDTGFDGDDLALFWQALVNMWDLDRSASRGLTSCQEVFVFSHDNALGNAPAHKLFNGIRVERKDNVPTPRSYEDYVVTVREELPQGLQIHRLVQG